MKRIYLFTLFLLTLVLLPEFLEAKTKVELMGSLLSGEIRRSSNADDDATVASSLSVSTADESISAYNLSSGVYTAFNEDLGYVLVEIVSTETEQVVYSSFVDSGYEDSFISTNSEVDLQSGEYYIRYTSVYGDLEGDLE